MFDSPLRHTALSVAGRAAETNPEEARPSIRTARPIATDVTTSADHGDEVVSDRGCDRPAMSAPPLTSGHRDATFCLKMNFNFNKHPPMTRSLCLRLGFAALLSTLGLASGCSDDATSDDSDASPGRVDASTPRFSGAVLCSLIFSPDGAQGYIRLVSDEELDSGAEIDATDGAVEFGGGAACAVWKRSVFGLSFEAPTITRYDEVDGALVPGETVSFAGFGITSLASTSSQTVIFSDTKAYYLDIASSQIVVWNPRAMETITSIELEVSSPPANLTPVSMRVNVFEGLLMLYNAYQNASDVLTSRTDFWFVDPATDTIIATDTTNACGNLQTTVATTRDGDVYIGPSAVAVMEHTLGLPGSFQPCAVRVKAGTREVDDSYVADLNTLAGGIPAAGPIPVAPDRALLLAYDTGAMPVDDSMTARELTQVVNWNLYEWAVGTTTPAASFDSGLGTITGRGGVAFYDGKPFFLTRAADFSSTTYVDLAAEPPRAAFTFTGGTILVERLGD